MLSQQQHAAGWIGIILLCIEKAPPDQFVVAERPDRKAVSVGGLGIETVERCQIVLLRPGEP